MIVLFRALALTVLLTTGQAAMSSPVIFPEWSNLPDPAAQEFDDPYRDLTAEQFDDVLFVVRMRARLAKDVGTAEERQNWQHFLVETEDALADDAIDVDWLLSQRQTVTERRNRAATAGNPELNGEMVTVAGFAIPAPADDDGVPNIYLVPERGMCSHMPPPPPNQMIRVQLNADWTTAYTHVPVRVTGRLAIDPSERMIVVVDGRVPMRATFRLDAIEIDDLGSTENTVDAFRSVEERTRAAGRSKTGGTAGSD